MYEYIIHCKHALRTCFLISLPYLSTPNPTSLFPSFMNFVFVSGLFSLTSGIHVSDELELSTGGLLPTSPPISAWSRWESWPSGHKSGRAVPDPYQLQHLGEQALHLNRTAL